MEQFFRENLNKIKKLNGFNTILVYTEKTAYLCPTKTILQ